jgi:hypothetical protein
VNVRVAVPGALPSTVNGACPLGAAVAEAVTVAILVFELVAVTVRPGFVTTSIVVTENSAIDTGFGDETGGDGSGVGVAKI